MDHNFRAKAAHTVGSIFVLLAAITFGAPAPAQSVYVVDQFNPSGIGANSYAGGQIGNVWGNWFGDAFQSLSWDSTSDASNNASSGSMKITASFNSADGNSQFEVYDFNGTYPPVNGMQYTNFQCDVRFDPSSATVNNTFGHLQFGITVGYNQDYFGSVDVPASSTNWVHVSLPINAVSDPNLQNIYNVLIHIYGPTGSGLNGTSILWVDNIKFVGANPVATNCVVNWNDVHQRIDGFGASSAWDGSTWSPAKADMFFSTNTGIGLSLLRNRIAPGGTTVENSVMQLAQARGARVWSTPWSPQVSFKSTNSVNGGNFLSASNQAYASQLAGYVVSMKNAGINLFAISVQNEPDVSASYESCLWTPQQIHDFVPYLHNALVASNVASTKIILAEDENWQTNYYLTAMNDPAAATNVGIIACHDYDGTPPGIIPPALPKFSNTNSALWETEVSTFENFDGSIANAMYWAERIHLFMTVAEANAFHYWWLTSAYDDNEGLTDNSGNPAKRMYVLGNYSRFVRPNFYRIGVSNNAFTSVSAYKDTNSGNFAIIAINSSFTTVTQVFNLTNFTTSSVTPWITSSNLSLASQSPIALTNMSFSYALPALSVVTFVGQGVLPNTPPTLAPVANQTINAGFTLVLTNTATDTDQPPQALYFSLLSAPTNATLTSLNNTNNAVFSWRPLVSQASTTNLITVQVSDSGTPSLSATNNFTVTVNPLAQPVVSSISVSGGQVSLVATGAFGPDYTVLTSTDLVNWQILFTSNSPAIPVTLVDTNFGTNPVLFYRIQLGP